MSRHTIRDDHGNAAKGSGGGSLFWSDKDGDSNPDTNQTVYEESHKIGVGSTKADVTYNPSEGTFNKK